MKSRKGIPYTIAAVAIGVLCNVMFNVSMNFLPTVPLFMDSLFTVAVTFIAGLVPGLITGLISNFCVLHRHASRPVCSRSGNFRAVQYIERACSIPCFPARKFPSVFFDLFLLSTLVAVVNSVLGGIISSVLFKGLDKFPSDYIVAGMLIQDIPVMAAAVLARIPINLIDKTIAVFGGYGLYLVASRKE